MRARHPTPKGAPVPRLGLEGTPAQLRSTSKATGLNRAIRVFSQIRHRTMTFV